MWRSLLPIIFSILLLTETQSQERGEFTHVRTKSKDIQRYYQLQKKYTSTLCPKGTDVEFDQLFKEFKGRGWAVPLLDETNVDVFSIRGHIPQIEKKISWIKQTKEDLKKHFNYQRFLEDKERIEKILADLLDLRMEIEFYGKDLEKNLNLSQEKWLELREAIKILTKNHFFFLTYGFPVDHLEDRRLHDELREDSEQGNKKFSNHKMLSRSLYEDGAQDKDRGGSDIFLRMAINTVYLESLKQPQVLPESVRVDLEYILSQLDRQYRRGITQIEARFEEWQKRTEESVLFYNGVLKDPATYAKQASHSRRSLKDFVGKKNAASFEFWINQDQKMRSLFVLETILLNEVGDVDGEAGLERKDVAKIVFKRTTLPEYFEIKDTDALWPYLKELHLTLEKINSYPWLGVLFKQGEFSFTYYFLSASLKTFCPDFGPSAKRLRNSNLSLGWDILDSPDQLGSAERYFSRASMKGRINMAQIWKGFHELPERPGRPKALSGYWRAALENGRFRYLYSFQGEDQKLYRVVVLDGQKLVWRRGKENGLGKDAYFSYRDPDFFRYFAASRP